MILGIGLFGTLAASLTAVLTTKPEAKPEVSNSELLERIDALEDRISALITRQTDKEDTP